MRALITILKSDGPARCESEAVSNFTPSERVAIAGAACAEIGNRQGQGERQTLRNVGEQLYGQRNGGDG